MLLKQAWDAMLTQAWDIIIFYDFNNAFIRRNYILLYSNIKFQCRT